jgi:hypothetical protein
VRVDEADGEVCVACECAVHGALPKYLAIDAVGGDGGDAADHVAAATPRAGAGGMSSLALRCCL